MSERGRDVTVRVATLDDAEAITRVHVATWQVAYRGQLPDAYLDDLTAEIPRRTEWRRGVLRHPRDPAQSTFVAVRSGEVVGFVSSGPSDADATRGEVYAIYVDPAAWSTGAGRALMERAVAELAALGFSHAVLWVLESNARARRFYERAGWVADGATKVDTRGDVVLREMRYARSLTAART